jgi:hypothetical protein
MICTWYIDGFFMSVGLLHITSPDYGMFTTISRIVEYVFKNNSRSTSKPNKREGYKYLFADGKTVPWIRTIFPGWKPPSMIPT